MVELPDRGPGDLTDPAGVAGVADEADECRDPAWPYAAIVLVSFGGPQGPDEVLPFLRRVTAGRGIPDERLAEVGAHYALFGGVSPLPELNRELAEALASSLRARGARVPVLVGQRHSPPLIVDSLRSVLDRSTDHATDREAGGVLRVLAVLTSAYPSYSSCRQYREDLADALAQVEAAQVVAGRRAATISIDKLAPYALTEAFAAPNERLLAEAIDRLWNAAAPEGSGPSERSTRVLFVTHSIPQAMDDLSGPGDEEGNLYTRHHLALANRMMASVAERTGHDLVAELVFCSRSGRPADPWLEPDVDDRLRELGDEGVRIVVLVPIGFVSDHMEVVYDLDTAAAHVADEVGIELVRVPTVGSQEDFVSGLADLVLERAGEARGERPAPAGPLPAECAPGCCPNLRGVRPAVCGAD